MKSWGPLGRSHPRNLPHPSQNSEHKYLDDSIFAYIFHIKLKSKKVIQLIHVPVGYIFYQEMFENTKGVIRSGKSKKDTQHNDQKKKGIKGKKMTYKTLHRKLNI